MRKASVSAQLTRTARRFSTVIAPQLTKIEPIAVLQKHRKLIIRIANTIRLQEAIKQFVLHNNRHFDPVEFEVRATDVSGPAPNSGAPDPAVVLIAQFYAEEIVLFEGNRRLLSICLSDNPAAINTAEIQTPTLSNPFSFTNTTPPHNTATAESPVSTGGFGTTLAKVRHPISGIKVFEVIESTPAGASRASWIINGTMDELNKCRIDSHSNLWRQMLSSCGFAFANEWWSVEHAGIRVAQLCPQCSLFTENAICVEWAEEANNELRLLSLCFGIIQTIREAYPSLLHITMGKHEKRKSVIA